LQIDKVFLIAEPMGKASWTKCFAAGGGAWAVELVEWLGQGRLGRSFCCVEYECSVGARSILEAACWST
jgi:hypothetical protein